MPNKRSSTTSPFIRNQKSEFAAIITGVVAFIGVIIPAFFGEIPWPVTLLLLSVLIYLLGNRVADFFLKTENNVAMEEIIKAVRDPIDHIIDCTYVGTYEEAVEYVRGKLKVAEYVKDTIIAYGIPKSELDIYFYDHESRESAQGMFADLVQRGKVYRAVISSDESIKNMFRRRAEAAPPNMHIKVLKKGSFPSINFTILEYGPSDDNREVLFGWGHHIHDERGHVFSSKNGRVVDTFDKLFQTLSGDAEDFDPSLSCKDAVKAAERLSGIGNVSAAGGQEAGVPADNRRDHGTDQSG